ncbi:MAG TPA: NAD-glutamate dehydrogenase [Candidatus Avipropionibacterium avicola]|uniref:NAD-glutamate dehydrogenase n=1 Tax=Candidatus Avipropionibacterium avicola TaxID=2840701 RepID=A0A9D1GXN6_9ACTN|nr:NAD-glutamate dehydrogenase [Candidatus Avipropionibacterium avicola]
MSVVDEDKATKLSRIAHLGADLAARIGAGPDQGEEFLAHYFRHVDAEEVVARPDSELLGIVGAHYTAALTRPDATSHVSVFTPRTAEHGWSVHGATVVHLVTDDKPFLVDTAVMEITRQGWSVGEIYHPQFVVARDVSGALQRVLHTAEAEGDPAAVEESWIHIEILPGTASGSLAELESGLHRVLRDVDEVVADWDKMRRRATELAETLDGEDRVFLSWLAEDNFTFLGYRHYLVNDTATGYQPDPGTGLGILRSDSDPEDSFQAWDPEATLAQRLVVTEDNFRSTVHRDAYVDHVAVRTFDEQGRLTGEHRILGLFGASAYNESVFRLPLLRVKAQQVLAASGYSRASHGDQTLRLALDAFPRDELFQTEVDELVETVERIARLNDRRQVRLLARRDSFGRFWSCLVFLPRDRYTTEVRSRIQTVLAELAGGQHPDGAPTADWTVQVGESVLARLHVVVRAPRGREVPGLDVAAAEEAITRATRTWTDDFADELARREADTGFIRLAASLPEGYKEDFSAHQALLDLSALADTPASEPGRPATIRLALYAPEVERDQADLRLKVFCRDATLSLSQVLPHLSALGVDVIDERPYDLTESWGQCHIYDFGLRVPAGRDTVATDWTPAARERFMDAFQASWTGAAEPDEFQALVTAAAMAWEQAAVLRAFGRYLRQVRLPYSQTYIASALRANPDLAARLVELFEVTFDPSRGLDAAERDSRSDGLADELVALLRDVASLDHDRIIRTYLRVIRAVVRTNAYLSGHQAWSFKLLPQRISGIPEPRPAYEIFVYSPRVEGVHLRFGAVARGGLRWSDRSEDYRTEVLGLVKAQMVKNSVIVPTGAKGGFVAKSLPDPSDREAWMAEGIACYRIFISSLLEITDTMVDGQAVGPAGVIRLDGDDPYLVVAADKGTASFSDIANELAIERDFWMGDAFASGGSAGYDHKGMGITARGAWVSVQRHFRELGIDCQQQDFTAVGIGDMSGDVFGNGMLRSRHTRLVAAFDHRHIFIDPDPDAATGFAERQRLFDLPRSSWADYDTTLISEGGGVFDRRVKSIPVTAQIREALGIDDEVSELAPAELIRAVLTAPVDLLWNGGIGTYVKARTESDSQVGDRSNDPVRVDGADLRVRCVGEGGNLGFTQRGRIEYARAGGLINTDFIDNSAGVDTSDHEVNIKVLLAPQVRAGALGLPERDALLESMTDEVAELVLQHNYDQNLALANAAAQSASMAGVHEEWMRQLEQSAHLNRALEDLPLTEEFAQRRATNAGLTSPELAVLLSYTKIRLAEQVLDSDLPDDPWLADRLVHYFPAPLQQRWTEAMGEHPLHREIITTGVVSDFVNRAGITCQYRIGAETGASPTDVIRAHLVAREVVGADELDRQLVELDHRIPSQAQTRMRLEVRTLVERATRWFAANLSAPIDIAAAVDEFAEGTARVIEQLPQLLAGDLAEAHIERRDDLVALGTPADLASRIALLPETFPALVICRIAKETGVEVDRVAENLFEVTDLLGLDEVLRSIIRLPRADWWDRMARAALRDDLHAVRATLTRQALLIDGGLPAWQGAHAEQLASVGEQLDDLGGAEGADLARMSVALRIVRSLVA